MDILSTIFIGLFFVVVLFQLYYWIQAISDLKEENALIFFNWVYLLLPEKFGDIGNKYRKKALSCFLIASLLVIAMVLLQCEL